MRRSIQNMCLLVAVVALVAVAVQWPGERALIIGLGAVVLIMGVWVYRTAVRTDRVVVTGMELIASQEFNNRIVTTGNPDTDKIVNLFNTMIDSLRGERIENMEQENFTQLITRASPMGVVMLDLDKRVSMVNPAFLKITDIAREGDILGMRLGDIAVPLVREMAATPLGRSDVVRDGNEMMYRCYHLSFIRKGARCEFYLLESLTEEVMKAERAAYEKVIRTISHEVNNTMGGVRTVLQMMTDTCDNEEMAGVLSSCDNRCGQMCAFVSAYADVVRLPEPMLQPTDLNDEVMRLMPFLETMMRPGLTLEFKPSESPAEVMIDAAMIQQVIVNVVKNAVESITSPQGMILIEVGEARGHVTLAVSNNGMPISEEVSRNLFRPFFTTKKGGRGIGLTLISEILNRHGARFSLRTAPDGITAFRIAF